MSWTYHWYSNYSFLRGTYIGTPAGPSRACLFLDEDDGYLGSRNNIPDPIDNHGADGGTVSFCDGHVSAMAPWVLYNPTNTASMWNYDHQPHPELWYPNW